MKKYFANCKNLEELKKEYRKLVMANHPDNGGDDKIMAEIIKEYKATFEVLKAKHNAEAKTDKTKKATFETADSFIDILNKIMGFEGLEMEICGSWLWVSGNTYPCKETLKAEGFQWSNKHKKWFWYHGIVGTQKSRKSYAKNFEQVRDWHGSEKVENESRLKIKG